MYLIFTVPLFKFFKAGATYSIIWNVDILLDRPIIETLETSFVVSRY